MTILKRYVRQVLLQEEQRFVETDMTAKTKDKLDALEHWSDKADRYGEVSLDDFTVESKTILIKDLYWWDDIDAWAEWSEKELSELDDEELYSELYSFRGSSFALRALDWIQNKSFPEIVIVEGVDSEGTPTVAIGDGRGRISVALGFFGEDFPLRATILTENPHLHNRDSNIQGIKLDG